MQTAIRFVPKEEAGCAIQLQSDVELLACFVDDRDGRAFEILVARYAPMMTAACRHALNHWQDVEDALQKTCLVLMRKAPSLLDKQDIGRWLKTAAYHVAQNVATTKKRREVHEGQCLSCLPAQPTQPLHDLVQREVRENINAAIRLLPVKLRVPFVLHFVEEKSRAEIAHELGLPEGTVATRLAKGKQMMQQELIHRGIIP